MAQCEHNHSEERGATRRLLIAFGVISVFMVVEAVGGFLAGSLALLADAAHMLTDACALGLAATAHMFARRPADQRNHFGYSRAQVLAAFVNGLALVVLLGWIAIEAFRRFSNPIEVDASLMLTVAFIGLAANAVAFFVLHRDDSRNVNVRGAMLHVISDLLGSIAAIIAAVVIMLTGFMQIDPLLSLLVAALIGHSAWRLLRETSHILLEGAPADIDIERLAEGVRGAAPAVVDVHDIRIWQLTPGQSSLTMHARVRNASEAEQALDRIREHIAKRYGIEQTTIQIEIGEGLSGCAGAPLIGSVTPITAARARRHHAHAASHDTHAPGPAALVSQK